MKIRIVTVGDLKKGPHRDLFEHYVKRIKRYTPFEYKEIKKETDLEKFKSEGVLVLCDERGSQMTSVEFSKFIEKQQIGSVKYLTFAIGPSEGFSEESKSLTNSKLSFSKFTLQHDFAAVILSEQVYRALTILKGEPYHKP